MNVCFYTTCNTVGVGCQLYQDNNATSIVTNGFYSNGDTCYQVVSGVITNISVCPTIVPSILASNVWIFSITRSGAYSNAKTSTSSDTVINSGTANVGNAQSGSDNKIGRLLAVFDTSSITTQPVSGTLSFYIPSNGVSTSLTFNNVKPNTTFLPNQTIVNSDWDNWANSNTSTSVRESQTTITAGLTGKVTLALSSGQLSDIYNNPQFSYYIISNGDLGNVSPSTDSRPLFSSERGLGLSGVGDYEIKLNY